jgi:lysozyme
MARRINAAGLALVKQWEGSKLLAYYDGGGVLTIGYGSTGKHVKPGMRISEAAAEKLLMDDVDRYGYRTRQWPSGRPVLPRAGCDQRR